MLSGTSLRFPFEFLLTLITFVVLITLMMASEGTNINEIKKVISFYLPEADIIMFGSRARGDNQISSDYDFLIISIDHAPDDIAGFSCHICDRHNGVGADGVEWVVSASDADLGIRLINADGSDAEISGNGTRCVAAWMALDTCDESNGCLQVVPGSHEWPILCTVPADPKAMVVEITTWLL